MPVTDEPHSASEKERAGGETGRERDREAKTGREETVAVLRRFRGRVSRLGVFIDTAIMHGGVGGNGGGNGKRRTRVAGTPE